MINPLHSLRTYAAQPAPAPRPADPAERPAPAAPQEPTRTHPSTALRGDVAVPLTAAEQTMIERQFPASASMRLYGPGRTTQTVTPAAVGNRLDLLA